MEQIIQERVYPQSVSHIPRLRLSPRLLTVVIMLIGFGVVNMGLMVLARYTPTPTNPFPAYADVFPGQPMSSVKARAFSCSMDYDYYLYAATECTLTPAEGIMSSIGVIVSGGIIHQITFIMRDNTLQTGDLARFLETPIVHRLYRTAYFFLPASLVRAETIGHGEQFSLFLPVWSVTFTI